MIHRREQPEISRDEALQNGVFLFILTMTYGIGLIQYGYHGFYYAMRVRVAISSLIYRKALRLSQKALTETAPGKLVNLLSNDLNRFQTFVFLHPLWISPMVAIIGTYLLWREIQWAGIIGVAVILFFTPIQSIKNISMDNFEVFN